MSSEFSNHSEAPDDLKHVEQTLAATTPRPPQIDRDRVMFLAGAASVKGSGVGVQGSGTTKAAGRWTWPAATATLAATSLALAIALIVRTNAPPRVVYVERPAPTGAAMSPQVAMDREHSPGLPAVEPEIAAAPRSAQSPQMSQAPQVPPDNYLRTREVALRMGLDALAAPRGASGNSASPMTYFDWLAGLGNDSSSLPPVSENDSSLPKM